MNHIIHVALYNNIKNKPPVTSTFVGEKRGKFIIQKRGHFIICTLLYNSHHII